MEFHACDNITFLRDRFRSTLGYLDYEQDPLTGVVDDSARPRLVVAKEDALEALVYLAKYNMKHIYIKDRWENENGVIGWSDEAKVKELSESDLRYIVATIPYQKAMTALKDVDPVQDEFGPNPTALLVGFVAWLSSKGKVAFVMELSIDRCFQGQGLGTLLMTKFEDAAAHAGYKRALLCVQNSNTMALTFYRKLKYTTHSSQPSYRELHKPLPVKRKKGVTRC
eukprot:Blabericola_migrator_1__4235@NODE_229_length_11083_cov_77_301198_g195_i0_p7_GENE_NODE_229_length_11083_cov_77_301198_g195_i0NODE_229_length_11083_cov_77_301198_g195_i0_p7_ORF_typecomplete_len225_score32_05Acetyltransf_1/PF00583_25/3_5e14Acetyltransf_10/PF13673_7/9e12Acetyltransf_7/PF13508_7/1_5e07Acetyltransf_4/PF13420_7/3_7e03Acetyltransf_4/PF13420_7/3_9e07FR47/PF08445_10/2_2e06Acetyltransf_3/PF13302_7/0_0041Acetyltransf_9/PF13527_7/0_004Acetyltransf_CG/PF14542_6/1_9e03Acetyltransf_CG/PF14542_6